MDLNELIWPLIVLVISIIVIIIFREEIRKFIKKADKVTAKVGSAEISVERKHFKKEVEKAKKDAERVERDYDLPEQSSRYTTITREELVSLEARDIVLVAHGKMRQQLMDLASSRGISPTNKHSLVNVLANLSKQVDIPEDINDLIVFLDSLGEDLAQQTSFVPFDDDALAYIDLINLLMAWLHEYVMMKNHVGNGSPRPGRRETKFSTDNSSFQTPISHNPTASLLGLSGPFQGQLYPIEHEHVRIGSSSDNDIQITNDDFISGHHCHIDFKDGLLLLEDTGSTNGTYLNQDRLRSGSPRVLNIGDKIKIGESLLEVRAA